MTPTRVIIRPEDRAADAALLQCPGCSGSVRGRGYSYHVSPRRGVWTAHRGREVIVARAVGDDPLSLDRDARAFVDGTHPADLETSEIECWVSVFDDPEEAR